MLAKRRIVSMSATSAVVALASLLAYTPTEASLCSSCPPPPPSNVLYGFIATNTTLTYASPGPVYDVVGDVVINPGITLTVEPGVTLRMASNHDTLAGGDYISLCEIDVRGSFVADASAGDSIRIVPSVSGPNTWGHIKLESGSGLTLYKVLIRGATTALNLVGGGSRILRHVAIFESTNGVLATSASAEIRDCSISGAGTGSGVGLEVGQSVSTIPDDSTSASPTTVTGFYAGVRAYAPVLLTNVIARDNSIGFDVAGGATINYCTAARNGIGVTLGGGALLNSICAYNNGYGVRGACGSADYVDSWSNGINFYFQCGDSPGPHTASFDPFFVDPVQNDFRLEENSIFKNYSNSGGEIGAYGPGQCTTSTSTSVSDRRDVQPLTISPSPTRGPTTLRFDHRVPGQVSAAIVDLLGRRVRELLDEWRPAGSQRLTWDGMDDNGAQVAPGLYFWRIASGSERYVGRVVVAR